jgi:hypothetical protein
MCDNEERQTTPTADYMQGAPARDAKRDRAMDACYELANLASVALDRPVSREKLYSFIMSDWNRIARLAHLIHAADRRVKDRRRS